MSEPRIARPDDAGEVARLLDAFNREFDDYTPGVEVLEQRVRELIEDGGATFLVSDATAIASLRLRRSYWTGGWVAYLEDLYVAPEVRGYGHGRALLDACIAHVRERGGTSIEIGVDEPDEAAIRLYESAGFSRYVEPGSEHVMFFYEREL